MWSVGFETSSEKEKQLVRWQLYKLKILSGLLSFWILYVQYDYVQEGESPMSPFFVSFRCVKKGFYACSKTMAL